MPETLTMTIKNDLAEIEVVSQRIDDFVARHQLPAKLAFDLNLAVDELLTNVISYGYEDGLEHTIRVRGVFADRVMTIEIEDDGRPFNPLEMPEPDLTAALMDRKVGGLGVHLVRQLMDQVEYQWQEGKNLLMIKKVVR